MGRKRGNSWYEKEAERRWREGWGVKGKWTFAAKDELKSRGFYWCARGRCWAAPDLAAKQLAEVELGGAVLPATHWSMTVHGDAGFKDGVGRWAWCVKYEDHPYLEGHKEESGPANVATYEARSLAYGLAAGLEEWPPHRTHTDRHVYLRNDNKGVVTAIQSANRKHHIEAVRDILNLAEEFGLKLDVKHVKGHQRSRNSTAAWMNNRVDRRSSMRWQEQERRRRGQQAAAEDAALQHFDPTGELHDALLGDIGDR